MRVSLPLESIYIYIYIYIYIRPRCAEGVQSDRQQFIEMDPRSTRDEGYKTTCLDILMSQGETLSAKARTELRSCAVDLILDNLKSNYEVLLDWSSDYEAGDVITEHSTSVVSVLRDLEGSSPPKKMKMSQKDEPVHASSPSNDSFPVGNVVGILPTPEVDNIPTTSASSDVEQPDWSFLVKDGLAQTDVSITKTHQDIIASNHTPTDVDNLVDIELALGLIDAGAVPASGSSSSSSSSSSSDEDESTPVVPDRGQKKKRELIPTLSRSYAFATDLALGKNPSNRRDVLSKIIARCRLDSSRKVVAQYLEKRHDFITSRGEDIRDMCRICLTDFTGQNAGAETCPPCCNRRVCCECIANAVESVFDAVSKQQSKSKRYVSPKCLACMFNYEASGKFGIGTIGHFARDKAKGKYVVLHTGVSGLTDVSTLRVNDFNVFSNRNGDVRITTPNLLYFSLYFLLFYKNSKLDVPVWKAAIKEHSDWLKKQSNK